jgi:polysaccharide biosynthesis protein PelC
VIIRKTVLLIILACLVACARPTSDVFRDQYMDFGTLQTIAVMPFANQTREQTAAERVRDVFINRLLSTGGVYCLPIGEVKRGTTRAGISDPTTPSPEEVVKFGGIVKADAVIVGNVKEYGDVRSGTATANMIAVSMQMLETQTGRVVWAASSTRGGVTMTDRLFGGGGEPMNVITEKAVDDIIHKLFK